jgi:hypothetical protein
VTIVSIGVATRFVKLFRGFARGCNEWARKIMPVYRKEFFLNPAERGPCQHVSNGIAEGLLSFRVGREAICQCNQQDFVGTTVGTPGDLRAEGIDEAIEVFAMNFSSSIG